MGILDDAIREHLELKRKHGVPAEEVERQEEEALGPARREVAPPQQDTADGAGEPAMDEPVAEVPQAEPEQELSPEPQLEAEPEPEPEPEPGPAAVALSTLEEAPAPAADTPPRGFERIDEEHDQPLVTGEPEDVEHAEDGEDPDVLEDTPDFLQETPEHDRLWFEQKPPRDFDFD